LLWRARVEIVGPSCTIGVRGCKPVGTCGGPGVSMISSDQGLDERARFIGMQMPEAAHTLIPPGSRADDLPATRPAVDLRPRLVSFLVHWHNWITAKIAVELARGAAFLCLPVLMGLGVILYYAFPAEPAAIAILSTAVCLTLATWLSRSRSLLFFVLAALLAVVLGAGSAKFEVWRA